jgi:hypothetical protein
MKIINKKSKLMITMTIAMTLIIMITTSFNSYAQDENNNNTIALTTAIEETNQNQTFRSAFETFVNSEPQGYGIYEEKESNVFRPGESLILYIEPVGYNYGNTIDENGNKLYTMNFSAAFIISDTQGNILAGQQDVPISDIVSHKQNKEVIVPFTITQSTPFPPGDYIITYIITDKNSGKSFDVVKNVTITES